MIILLDYEFYLKKLKVLPFSVFYSPYENFLITFALLIAEAAYLKSYDTKILEVECYERYIDFSTEECSTSNGVTTSSGVEDNKEVNYTTQECISTMR